MEDVANAPQIFVSYAHVDGDDLFDELEWLRDQGFGVFYDADIEGGDDWSDRIAASIDSCRVLVFYCSTKSVNSRYCLDEIGYAHAHGKPILTLFLDTVDLPRALELRLGNQQALHRGRTGSEDHRAALLGGLTRLADAREASQLEEGAWDRPAPVIDRPSIAVLPFVNLTGSADDDALVEGLTHDLTTLLCRIPEFFVISHATSRFYRGRIPEFREIRAQLGVRYILEGQVRAANGRYRVTAQLRDTASGNGLWTQRFDRELRDPFEFQDDITIRICSQLEQKIRARDIEYGERSGNVAAWRLWQQGWYRLFIDAPMPAPFLSIELFERAVELDGHYPLAQAGLAAALAHGMLWGGVSPKRYPEARALADAAFRELPDNPAILYTMGMLAFIEPTPLTEALEFLERAVELEPGNAVYHGCRGYLQAMTGDADGGLETCDWAMRLSPRDSREPLMCWMRANCEICLGRYDDAIRTFERAQRFNEIAWVWIMIGFCQHQLGDSDASVRRSLEKALALGAQSRAIYRYSIMERLWPGLPAADKERFLACFEDMGFR